MQHFYNDQWVLRPKYSSERAETFINNLDVRNSRRYLKYWKSLKPRTTEDYYWMWIFGFCSVRTRWQQNVNAFLAIQNLPAGYGKLELAAALKSSGCGLDKMRVNAIWDFNRRFWNNAGFWYRKERETFTECRNRLSASTYGIGLAKTSFVLEMACPECDVVCLDTHMLKLYNYRTKSTPNDKLYHQIERHWVEACEDRGIASPIARQSYFDLTQSQPDCRCWSYVLEKDNVILAKTA